MPFRDLIGHRRLLELLKKGGVSTYLSGHLHRPLTNRMDGMLLVTTGPVSFGLPRGKQPEGWTLVIVPAQGEARTEFRTIESLPAIERTRQNHRSD